MTARRRPGGDRAYLELLVELPEAALYPLLVAAYALVRCRHPRAAVRRVEGSAGVRVCHACGAASLGRRAPWLPPTLGSRLARAARLAGRSAPRKGGG